MRLRWLYHTYRCRIGWHVGPFTQIQPVQHVDQVEVEHVVPGTMPRQGAHKKCGWCGASWVMNVHGEWARIK